MLLSVSYDVQTNRASFVYKKKYVYVVKRNMEGQLVYRDQAHYGGPWSLVKDSIAAKANYDPVFIKLLKLGADKVK
jgi:hypothetical protein